MRGAVGDAAIQKIIKKFCKSEFLTGLLRQLLCNFLAMMDKQIHATMPARNDVLPYNKKSKTKKQSWKI
ncbi:hypothetical protein UQ52_04400 [Rickettsia conorii subsp. raoultii]|uniref:Uncharacterized protein n=1 Tax=Rickettsia conorii subsp. raoultii TaxID=369822 RepID=A0A9N7B0S5_RICCR|nr:hypothetical protein UQ52_04400 [Rickettsia conorii subsp. raoultii]APZ30179.1 hypothetical protein RRIM16_04720 [Rickettsia conorii subsp. raoultii]